MIVIMEYTKEKLNYLSFRRQKVITIDVKKRVMKYIILMNDFLL